ncbi:sensor histidine kinase, partial [Pseudomonas syringae pv. actinidiae ICMP 19096]
MALYSSLFVAWSVILLGVLYWEVNSYLDTLARESLTHRQQLFSRFEGQALVDALATSMTFDTRAVDAYGLFDQNFRPVAGPITSVPENLPIDGLIHVLSDCIESEDPGMPQGSCDAIVNRTSDGRWL